jgi:hypothetical protein
MQTIVRPSTFGLLMISALLGSACSNVAEVQDKADTVAAQDAFVRAARRRTSRSEARKLQETSENPTTTQRPSPRAWKGQRQALEATLVELELEIAQLDFQGREEDPNAQSARETALADTRAQRARVVAALRELELTTTRE